MFFAAVWSVTLPLLFLVFPGAALVFNKQADRLAITSRIILWSLSGLILLTTIAAWLHVWSIWLGPAIIIVTIGLTFWRYGMTPWLYPNRFHLLLIIVLVLVPYAFLSVPFLLQQNGLPSGDSEKAIIWAQQIQTTHRLPNYQLSSAWLNRDPVDFYTPGLHALTALLMQLSPYPLTSLGFFSIALSLGVVIIALSLARLVAPDHHYLIWPLSVAWLILTNIRFLRYLNAPGYHYQNVIGEVLLFGLLLLGLSVLKKWRWSDIILASLIVISLALSHQFSAFLAAFVLLPIFLLILQRQSLKHVLPFIIVVSLLGIGGLFLGLATKIPHLFTRTPHLANLVPDWTDYPGLIGTLWIIAGLAGLFICLKRGLKQWRNRPELVGFASSAFVLLLLSQGPRFGLDIPPVRALFYSAVPLSLGAGLILVEWWHLTHRRIVAGLIIGLLLLTGTTSLTQAFTIDHTIRTNSTVTPGELYLSNRLGQLAPGGVLIDDYNRRSASWLVLSGHPMYTRIAADISQQMAEAKQSPLRYQLYLNQLDFEKIFSLSSLPVISSLLEKHDIRYLTGIAHSSNGFSHNPVLQPVALADDLTLFSLAHQSNQPLSMTEKWLLKPTTLANDIGDDEDTFDHLPAAVAAPRLSQLQVAGSTTYRSTTAPAIPLRFNVNDYVSALWEKSGFDPRSSQLQILIQLAQPSPGLTIRTTTGWAQPLTGSSTTVIVPGSVAPIESDGFITVTLENPTQAPVAIDLIALGLPSLP